MKSNNDTQIKAIEDSIVEQVGTHWSDTHSGLLLTTLGSNLKNYHPDYKPTIGMGLETFLRARNIVQLVNHPDIKQKVGLVPLGVQFPTDLRLLFAPRRRASAGVNFKREFWNAFHLPLGNERRFVIITSDGFEVRNLQTPPEQQHYEILSSDIVVNDGASIHDLVARKWTTITKWLERNELTANKFAVTGPTKPEIHKSETRGSGNVLGLLSRLEQQDQARILIPLDILSKLLG